MGKASRRAGRASRDFHEAVRAAAAVLKATPAPGMRDAADFPEVETLLHAARDAVASGTPRFIFVKGRNYWLRVRLAAQIDVFDKPTDREPLLSGLSMSSDDAGHAPGH